MRLIFSALLPLWTLGCADATPCKDGYGRASDGVCHLLEREGVVESVQIGPADVGTHGVLSATVVVDGETIDGTLAEDEQPVVYAWFADEESVGENLSTLDGAAHFSKGQAIHVEVSSVVDTADAVASNTVTVGNTAPPPPEVTVSPEAPLSGADALSCVVGAADDPDGDPLHYTVSWTVDGVAWGSGVSADDSPPTPETVSGSETSGGQEWICTAVADDGEDDSEPGQANVLIHASYLGWGEGWIDLEENWDYLFVGENKGDGTGAATAALGDVDGDGAPDFAITSYFNSDVADWSGKIYLVRAADIAAGPGRYELGEMPIQFLGEGDTDEAGHNVSEVGDMDGDGLDDLMFCGYRNDDPVEDVGRAYLFLAASFAEPGVRSAGSADVVFIGEASGDRLAHSMSYVGDVTGDGANEIVISGYGHDGVGEDSGKLYIFPSDTLPYGESVTAGGDEQIMYAGEAAGDIASHSTRSAGDVDGDGLGDIVLGARMNDTGATDGGKGYLLLGANLGSPGSITSLADADTAVYGEIADGWLGYQASGAGDVDGDGLDEFFFGAHASEEYKGRTYFWYGSTVLDPISSAEAADIRFEGTVAHDQAGRSLSAGGDVDADGLDDLLIGARNANDHAGLAYLVLGSSLAPGVFALENSDAIFAGEGLPDEAGYSFINIGDLNRDGLGDLMLGAWQVGPGPENSGLGKTYLLLTPGE